MRPITFLIAAALTMAANLSVADGNPVAGEAAYNTCTSCHGARGEGNQALGAPRLAHLEPVYVVAQLQKFKSGLRGGSGSSPGAVQMAAMAATLADEQAILDVAAHIATLDGPVSAATVEGDVGLGGDYFNQFCGACHGAAAQGNAALSSPRLAGTDDWYLVTQLHEFRSGTRGNHAEDRTGRQMRAMAGVLPDEQAIANVVAFIRNLPE